MAYKRSRRWGLPEYTVRGCTMTKNRSKWCHRICEPNADGTGHCGRLAPHAMTSQLQQAIRNHKEKRVAA